MIIRSHRDLDVYTIAFQAAMEIYDLTKNFPIEEKYSMTDQMRRASRSVCANLAEAFRKRKYPKSFIAKLSDSEAEAAEVQTWLEFALTCNYINTEKYQELYIQYDSVIGKLVKMSLQPEKWQY
ncbi:MAG: four helix bundle protein [Bacteroidota bacterium]